MSDYARIRQRLHRLREEEDALLEGMMKAPKMVRGRLTWHKQGKNGEHKYPGLIRTVGGKSIGRRVRLGHVEWLEPLLENFRWYRERMQRIRAIHQEKMELVEQLRHEQMYDYEATAPGHLVRIEWVEKGEGTKGTE